MVNLTIKPLFSIDQSNPSLVYESKVEKCPFTPSEKCWISYKICVSVHINTYVFKILFINSKICCYIRRRKIST